jgi:hypothetical protein
MSIIRSSEKDETIGTWRKVAALGFVVAVLRLPINDHYRYGLLLLAAVPIFIGTVSREPKAWFGAIAVVALAIIGQSLLAPPRIDEGHNVFLPGGPDRVLERELPREVYRHLADEFDKQYPPARRCRADVDGCWQSGGFPDRAFAFSADGIFHKSTMSRSVAAIDFADPIWLRLGFINENRYNWNLTSDVQRTWRDRRFWMGLHRWHLTMPWYEAIRLTAPMVGGELCWRGELMWEGDGEHFAVPPGDGCRTISTADVGRRIFGVGIKPDTLAMHLTPPRTLRLLQIANGALLPVTVFILIVTLVRFKIRRTILPFILIGLAIAVVAIDDASFLGGMRPFDGGDDGLVYDGWGRLILQKLMAGDLYGALEGNERVFYYGGPGLRYFRALEHIVFGESYLGYLSLILALPFLVLAVFKRFFTTRTALALALIFLAVPIGALFGSTFFQYAKWAARGFADPAAAVMFLAGFVCLVGRNSNDPDMRFGPACGAGLLFALALWFRPNLAPGVAVLLGGTGLTALWQGEIRRFAGMCIGFLPVFGMALHNWYFGGVFVLFSSNATITEALPMPPAAYVAALGEVLRLDFSGEHVRRGILQLARWLAGPSESFFMVPLHVAAIGVLVRVGLKRRFDRWIRLTAWASLALHAVPLFYLSAGRYYYLSWFLTMLVCAAWLGDEGIAMLRRRFPRVVAWAGCHPARIFFARKLDWLAATTDVASEKRI